MSPDSTISLETAHENLGWPNPENVTHPKGAGASVFAALVREKIGSALRHLLQAQKVRIGVLMEDPDASTSEPPLAIVAEFNSEIDAEVLRELHRLSWNFSHVPVVITIEPTLLRAWSCCEAPDPEREIDEYLVRDFPAEHLEIGRSEEIEVRAAHVLHWVNLASGQFFAEHSSRFNRNGRADQMLLQNLRYLREELKNRGLTDDDICHDLLARVIFVQFLFDRKDRDGNPALTDGRLLRLQEDGVLKNSHSSFEGVLLDYEDTYHLFDWLNAKFNGDLFPGKGNSSQERAEGWAKEKEIVEAKHLSLLADFVRGDLDMPSGQMCLWPQYAFDVIPLEFISSIYETFVNERASQDGIYYTPPHLVDFVLDRVLPWGGTDWDLKIMDPACGSGIFLVKSFQRLVHRWKLSNQDEQVRAETLRRLLERNIFGVDKDPHAVRVACFSLYLAMCDEIEPRYYWTQVKFPTMRQRRLVHSDFFCEDKEGFNTERDAGSYDLVIGNAPFGAGVITDHARTWATSNERRWSIPNKDIGGLFLAKGAQLVSEAGRVAFIQSANALLFNVGKAADFRKELFTTYKVEEIYNLSALRFRIFKGKKHTAKTSMAPVCVIVLRREIPSLHDTITYISPKHLRPLVDELTIVIEPGDRCSLSVQDAITDRTIWSKLMWGNPRDLQLIKKLQNFPSLKKLDGDYKIKSRVGVGFGDKKKSAPYLVGKRIFREKMFSTENIFSFNADDLHLVKEDIRVHSRDSTNLEAFSFPQIIVKRSWNRPTGRFHVRFPISKDKAGILCNESYISIHSEKTVLEAACFSHNSKIAVYFHFLTSGRFAAYRPRLLKDEILNLPMPDPESDLLQGIESYQALDEHAFKLFGLKDAERVLIEDTIEYTLEDFLGRERTDSKGKQRTSFGDSTENETHMRSYCSYFLRVLKAGFGKEKLVSATIFRCLPESVPYRLVAFALGAEAENEVEIKNIQSSALLEEFKHINQKLIATTGSGGIYNQRVARIYEVNNGIPTVFVIKPDQKRFWTRSMGLKDGDEVALDLFRWQQQAVAENEEALH